MDARPVDGRVRIPLLGRFHERLHISTRQHVRIVRKWATSIGLEASAMAYIKHVRHGPMRRLLWRRKTARFRRRTERRMVGPSQGRRLAYRDWRGGADPGVCIVRPCASAKAQPRKISPTSSTFVPARAAQRRRSQAMRSFFTRPRQLGGGRGAGKRVHVQLAVAFDTHLENAVLGRARHAQQHIAFF